MKQLYITLLGAIIGIFLFSCSTNTNKNTSTNLKSIQGEAQGTTYTIKYYGNKDIAKASIDSLLNEIDLSMSNWNSNSAISKFNSGMDSVKIDEHFLRNLSSSYIFNRESEGAFNPLVKPLLDYYGLSKKTEQVSEIDSNELASIVERMNMDSIFLVYTDKKMNLQSIFLSSTRSTDVMLLQGSYPIQLDFNAIAQGYSVDALAMLLKMNGSENYLIELGGEMLASGTKEDGSPWKVGIERPEANLSERILQATVSLNNKGVATSGNYRKFYELNGQKIHHTINPVTGYPAQHNLLSATVIGSTCMEADALATSFMVMGLKKAKAYLQEKKNGVEAFLIYSNSNGEYEYFITDGLKNELEIKE